MTSSAPPAPTLEARLSPTWRVDFGAAGPQKPINEIKEKGPVAEALAKQAAEAKAEMRRALAPGQLVVQIDEAAGRFVSTLTDAATKEVVWRYPNEAQLAFSRAVNAYRRALAGG